MISRSLFSALLALVLAACDSADPSGSDGPEYTRAFITGVTVEQIPMSAPDGSGWDLLDGPDVYFQIRDTQDVLLVASETVQQNVGPGDIPFGWSTNVQVSDWNRSYTLTLWDHDGVLAHDLVGMSAAFAIENHTADSPQSIALDRGDIRVRVSLRWE